MRTAPAEGNASVVEAMHAMDAGDLVAYPEATGYLLGADALDEDAVEHARDARKLAADRALPVLVADLEDARHVARVTMTARRIAAHGLPAGVLLVLPAAPTAPDALTAGGSTVAVHVATHPFARELAGRFGPVVATGAHPAGAERARDLSAVRDRLPGRVVLGLDGGAVDARRPTVVDATASKGTVLREGGVPASSVTL